MNALLTRWFRFEAGELSRVLWLMLLGGVLQAGLAMGQSAADSLFLARVGADRLPIIYVAMPAIMVLYIPVYSFLFGRYGVNRVFDLTLGLLVAGGIGCYFFLSRGTGVLPYYVAKCYSALWYVGIYTLFWNLVDSHFDLRNAKRLFGLLAAGPAAGAICGGEAVNRLAAEIPVPAFFLGWAACALLAWPVLIALRRRHPPLAVDEAGSEARPALRDTLRQIMRSRFVITLISVLSVTLITATICEYQYLGIFAEMADESTLAALFGQLYAGVNVFNLCISLFVFNRLVLRIGVRNMALIQAIVFLVVFALLLVHGGFEAALLGFLAYQGIMTSIDYNNINLLFNGLPEQGRSQVRTFVEGLCEPLATATAGIFLLLVAPRLSPGDLSAIGFGFAAVLLLLVFVMRADYVQSMIANVRRSWLDFTRAPAGFANLPDSDLALLEQRVDIPLAGERLTALRMLCTGAPVRALRHVLGFLSRAPREERPAAQPLVASLLATRDPGVLLHSMQWSEQHGETIDPFLLEELGRHRLMPAEVAAGRLAAADPDERAAAAALLWRSSQLPHGTAALGAMDELLRAGPAGIQAGIRGLGRMGEPRYVPSLLPYLHSPEPGVRLETLRALGELVDRESTRVGPPLLRRLEACDSFEEREMILGLIGRIADSNSLPQLLALAARFTPHQRRIVEQAVVGFGPRAVPTLVSIAQSHEATFFARRIAVRTLSRLAYPQLEVMAPALLESEIAGAYLLVGHSAALEALSHRPPGLALLTAIYRMLPHFSLEMVLELLSVTGRLPGHDSIVTALRSGSPRERGYAIENIEQGAGRWLFTRLAPFLDGHPPAEIARLGRTFGYHPKTSPELAIARSAHVHFPLEAAAALHAFQETNPGATQAAILDCLRTSTAPLLRETALELLHRMDGPGSGRLTPVERIHLVSQTGFFRDWGTLHLEFIDRHIRELPCTAGMALPLPAPEERGVHVVARGSFHVVSAAGAVSLEPGESFGGDAFLGSGHAITSVRATADGLVLFVPGSAILTCGRIHPEIAAGLLRRKLVLSAL